MGKGSCHFVSIFSEQSTHHVVYIYFDTAIIPIIRPPQRSFWYNESSALQLDMYGHNEVKLMYVCLGSVELMARHVSTMRPNSGAREHEKKQMEESTASWKVG